MHFLAQTKGWRERERERKRKEISNKLAGCVDCLGGSMVEHQPRLLGSRSFPDWVICDFFRFYQSFTSNFPFPFPFSFPFLVLSFPRPFPFPLPPTFRLRTLVHCPDNSTKLEFNDGVQRLGVREETASTVNKASFFILKLPQRESKAAEG